MYYFVFRLVFDDKQFFQQQYSWWKYSSRYFVNPSPSIGKKRKDLNGRAIKRGGGGGKGPGIKRGGGKGPGIREKKYFI